MSPFLVFVAPGTHQAAEGAGLRHNGQVHQLDAGGENDGEGRARNQSEGGRSGDANDVVLPLEGLFEVVGAAGLNLVDLLHDFGLKRVVGHTHL